MSTDVFPSGGSTYPSVCKYSSSLVISSGMVRTDSGISNTTYIAMGKRVVAQCSLVIATALPRTHDAALSKP